MKELPFFKTVSISWIPKVTLHHHHKAGSLYLGICNLCAQSGLKAEYTGESGFSTYTRNLAHLRAVRQNKPSSSALASHTKDYHPEASGKEETLSVRVLRTYKKPTFS